MPEATKPSKTHRSGSPAGKALGPQEEDNGIGAASQANTSSATAEPLRMANPLKARKRTKTGCLSKFSLVADLINSRSLICHSMSQAAH